MSRRVLAATALLGLAASVSPAHAFCGFFVSGASDNLSNNASQVVLMRKGNHTAMTMSNNYKGPPQDFAMVVPVPVVLKKEQVKTLRPEVFKAVDSLSAPRLVEYWEQDPCYVPPPPVAYSAPAGMRYEKSSAKRSADSPADYGVKIEAKFQEGEYQILILSAKDSGGLDAWLRAMKYKIPQGAAEALAPYVRDQMKFFVAKVDITKVKRDEHGLVVLSPLRFSFDSTELRLPVRLGLLNAESKQDLLVYVLSPDSRYEVANYKNAFIPTNLEVSDTVKTNFGAFYAELFDETVRRNNNRAIVTEYAWQTPILHRAPVVSWQSYHCDPCPAPEQPPPTLSDWVTLGDETILGSLATMKPGQMLSQQPLPQGTPESWTLTRLHTRYDKQALSEDLVFRSAKAMYGGTANPDGTSADQGATASAAGGENRFQGRYIIRHYWEGQVSCENPRYGIWTGPPSSPNLTAYRTSPGVPAGGGAPKVAGDLANAKRGGFKLSAVVKSAVPSPELRGSGTRPPMRKGELPVMPR